MIAALLRTARPRQRPLQPIDPAEQWALDELRRRRKARASWRQELVQ